MKYCSAFGEAPQDRPGIAGRPRRHPQAAARYLRGEHVDKVAKAYGVHKSSIYAWAKAYRESEGAKKQKGKAAEAKPDRSVATAIALLRQVRGQIDINDPVHLTAMLALQTLEGKM